MTLRYLAIICIILLSACQSLSRTTPSPTSAGITIRAQTPNPAATRTSNASVILPTRTIVPLQPCEGAVAPHLILQERARVTFNGERLRLRRGPNTSYEMIANLEPGDTFMVMDGPTCSEGYSWYRVQFGDITGWVAEGDIEQYFAEPFPPG